MTAFQLLGLINAALLVQVAVGVGVAAWRRQQRTVASPPDGVINVKRDAAWAGWREFRVARRMFEDAAHSQCSFYLQPIDGQPLPPFKPGQFLTFSLSIRNPGSTTAEGDRVITRCYSLSDRPDAAHYRVTIKRVPPPRGQPDVAPGLSSNYFHDHVREGDTLRVKAPSGSFCIAPDPAVPLVLIGGGIGITPMISMLRWCEAEQPQRTIHLYYGLRNGREHAFRQALEEIAASHPSVRLNIVYSQPSASDEAHRDYHFTGHIDIELLRRTLPLGRHQFYVCGPPAMMQTLVPALAAWGVPASDIHYEAFGPAAAQLAVVPKTQALISERFDVKFSRSGRTLSWDGRDASLLEFAERNGIEVESGCRSGACGSCETRLLEGSVTYERAPDFEVAPAHCLLCVSRPQAALVLDA